MSNLPAGTITFLLTDIEASSSHWEEAPDEMRAALAVHDRVTHEVIAAQQGVVVKHVGDGCWAAFGGASQAAAAAIEIQRRVQAEPEGIRRRLRLRIGLHTGDAEPTGHDYFGPMPNRIARVTDLANADQIVCSSAAAAMLGSFSVQSRGMHELRGIGVDEIFVLTADGIHTDNCPLRRPVVPSNLPRVRTSLFGREADVERTLVFLSDDTSVVTLLGPGGVGKTRLAVEVGTRFARSSSASVVFCDLAAVRVEDDVAAVVADAVGARQQPGMDLIDSIVDYLTDRPTLLILDNCEQVVEVARDIVDRLSEVDGVTMLTTSRAALHVPGEQLMDVQPLPHDGAGVDLFVARARAHDPSFGLNETNELAVRQITKRLDGIPLAIELAAARVRLMSPTELVAGLQDSFDVLNAGRKPGRHETLRETVMWSYQLLTKQEAAVFNRMSVFAGGATLDAIASVSADGDLVAAHEVPELVLRLVEQSMLVGRTENGYRRFQMLETMRAFGDDQLRQSDEQPMYRDRHAAYFASLASSQNDRIFTEAEPDAWRILDADWANLRVAVDSHLAVGDIDQAAQLIIDLAYYALFAMRLELFSWADELLEVPAIESHALYTDLCGAAALGAYLTVSDRVSELAEAGLAADPSDPQGWCRAAIASVFLNNVHTPEASDQVTSAWLASKPTTVGGQLWSHAFRAFHLSSHGMPDEAAMHAKAVVEQARQTKSVSAQALGAWAEGMVVSYSSLDDALGIWTDAREGPRSMPRDHLLDQLLVGLVLHFTVHQHNIAVVLENCRSALQNALDSHYFAGTSQMFGVTAIALSRSGDPETGAKLLGAMEGNGHLPRRNATDALQAALGDDLATFKSGGVTLSVTQAAHVAIEALEAAIACERAQSVDQVGADS